jgi:hypothetical protein
MSKPLLELKTVLDEVLTIIDACEHGPGWALRRATLALLTVREHEDQLPGDLKHMLSKLISCLNENAWIQHPDRGFAEIKRFNVAVLRAIQMPGGQTVH